MSDAVPDSLTAGPPPRDRRIVVTAAVSVALHLTLIGLVLLPRLHLPEPAEPPAVNVDLVPPEQVSSIEPVSSSEMPSSQELPSSEALSSELASSAEPSSAEASSEAASSEIASSAEASSAAEQPSAVSEPASSIAPPVPMARPIVIPVGPSAESSQETSSVPDTSASEEPSSAETSASEEASSAASEESSADASSAASQTADASTLTTTDTGASDAIAQTSSEPVEAAAADTKPIVSGALHTAKRFYLDAILSVPAMARAAEAIKKLPPEKRLSQTCNIEAIGQLGNAGKGYNPDALVADALAKPVMEGSSFNVLGGAFRSDGKWRAISYECTLSKDLTAVKSFSYRVGGDVTTQLKAKVGG
jgi:hypothetical protein